MTRLARTLRVPDNVVRDLDKAVSAALGHGGTPGPAYVEIPTDVLRTTVRPSVVLAEHLQYRPRRRIPPDRADVARATGLIRAARRPLVLSGRGARGAGRELVRFLDASGALYLDTQESRGLVPAEHRSVVGAVRARDAGDGPCVDPRPQARLPDGVRLTGGVPECAVLAHR